MRIHLVWSGPGKVEREEIDMTEQTVEGAPEPAAAGTRPAPRAGLRVRSAQLRLDGTFEPPHLVVDGEIDMSTLPTFDEALARLVAHSRGDVWVDVEMLDFIDVGGLRALAATACRLGLQDRRLVLRSVAPHLAKLMDLVGWSQISSLLMLARVERRSPAPRVASPCRSAG